jgi:menaquinone-dependent protoporphyrinogen oxidase
MLQVLVTYASKHHATAEIAEAIAETLQRSPHLNVTTKTVYGIKDIDAYQAVVLGSAVYAGQWQMGAVNFLKDHLSELSQRPVWLFSSGPSGEGDPKTLLKGWTYPEGLKSTIEKIAPRDIAVFHGKIDMNSLGFGERTIVKMVKAPVGDYRNWDQIHAWANDIALSLLSNISSTN